MKMTSRAPKIESLVVPINYYPHLPLLSSKKFADCQVRESTGAVGEICTSAELHVSKGHDSWRHPTESATVRK